MKPSDLFSVAETHRVLKCFVRLLTCVTIFTITVGAEHNADRTISLTVQNQPLSSVLHQISESYGYRFIYDKDWADLSITIRAQNLSLDKTLRKILANYNFTILYQEDGSVRIKLYSSTGDTSSYDQTGIDRTIYRQSHTETNPFNAEGYERESESAEDGTKSNADISENAADEQETDPEGDEREEVGGEDEQVNEENNEPQEQGSEEQAPDTESLADGGTAETEDQNIEN